MSFISSFFRSKPVEPAPVSGSGSELKLSDLKAEGDGQNTVDEQRSKTLWQLLSSAIGMDLSAGFTVPVYYCEKTTNLTKTLEVFEYAELLERAVHKPTPIERLANIAMFVISGYSNCTRTLKPLNPLLGETFEFIDKTRGIKAFCEQISHHPPISAVHVNHDGYTLWNLTHVKSKFLGNSIDLIPLAYMHLYLHETGEYYSWVPGLSKIHNLIVGSLWMEFYGEINIVNHATGDTCTLTLDPCGWFGRYSYTVHGVCKTREGKEVIRIEGKWNEGAEANWINDSTRAAYTKYVNSAEGQKRDALNTTKFPKEVREREERRMAASKGKAMAALEPSVKKSVSQWTVPPNNFGYPGKMPEFSYTMTDMKHPDEYYFTSDSRLRPDLRTLASNLSDRAIFFKAFLEDEQRKDRKKFAETEGPDFKWKPVWFQQVGENEYVYNGGYWEFIEEWRKKKDFNMAPFGIDAKLVNGLAMDFHRYNFAADPLNLTAEQREMYAARARDKEADKEKENAE